MKVLITGAAGFVGRHFYAACAQRGDTVTAVDIADGSDMLDWLQADQAQYDLVLHSAGFVNGRDGIDNDPAYLHTYNCRLDSTLFGWVLKTAPLNTVYFSSSAAYPLPLQSRSASRLTETHIDYRRLLEPEATYGLAKLHGEQMAQSCRRAGHRIHIFRPFSGYGTDQSDKYPFPSFIHRGLTRQNPFEIWGDGTQARDWIHIDDIVDGVFAALDSGQQVTSNLCTGVRTSFNELADMVCERVGYSPDYRHLLDRPHGVAHRVGDPATMLSFYRPKVSLSEGIARALAKD